MVLTLKSQSKVFKNSGVQTHGFALGKAGIPTAIVSMMCINTSSNYLVQINMNEWLTWGALTYPFYFFVTELSNRFYGPRTARYIVLVGFFIAVCLAFSFMNRRIAFASSSAFLVGQILDISVFNWLRKLKWWMAPALASVASSVVDTLVFFSLAFSGQEGSWIQLGAGDFCFKLVMDLVLLLLLRIFIRKDLS